MKEVNYFRVLAPLLLGKTFMLLERSFPQLKKFRREVDIFFYFELKKVIDKF